ncbi:response regulator transcription factor [Caballeronia sp. LZ034LL]|uniref:response regulator transcription factor n=1 Tax=Caballeronia sp. LZ034LL TaxID=3038567 RepID=UPI0028647950|nr:response regulator transcription factor [Caballeronia sp. LZ034LL]MDR5835122.1 response regulator transcription factor [Caballeronia sp. LZ034LL]
MYKVLSIEDDELVVKELRRALPDPRYHLQVARSGREGMAMAMDLPFDLITLDRVLPDLDGLQVLTAMRGIGMNTPVLIISSMDEADERVRGLRAGGDDYMAKPFTRDEVQARVDALLRRGALRAGQTILRANGIELDLVRRHASYHGKALVLQPTEIRVLEFMMRHAGLILTRTMIFEGVWGCRFDPGTNLIDVHVGRLRKKIQDCCGISMFRTIRGAGYMLDDGC